MKSVKKCKSKLFISKKFSKIKLKLSKSNIFGLKDNMKYENVEIKNKKFKRKRKDIYNELQNNVNEIYFFSKKKEIYDKEYKLDNSLDLLEQFQKINNKKIINKCISIKKKSIKSNKMGYDKIKKGNILRKIKKMNTNYIDNSINDSSLKDSFPQIDETVNSEYVQSPKKNSKKFSKFKNYNQNSFSNFNNMNKSIISMNINKNYKLVLKDYELIKELSKGSFFKIYLLKNKKNGKYYAAKIVENNTNEFKKNFNHLVNEINILSKISHPNIIKLKKLLKNDNKIFVMIEYANYKYLFSHEFNNYDKIKSEFSKNENYDYNKIRKYFRDIINGVYFLHSNNIIHGDIKHLNILACENNGQIDLKLADFGTSIFYQVGKSYKFQGTKFFCSPEAFLKIEDPFKVDIWCCGCILYKLIFKKYPFDDIQNDKIKENILNLKLNLNSIKDKYLMILLNGMLKKDPKERFSIEDVINNEWLTDKGKYDFKKFNSKYYLESNPKIDLSILDLSL